MTKYALAAMFVLTTVACSNPTAPSIHPNPNPSFKAIGVIVRDAITNLPIMEARVCGDKSCLSTNEDGYVAFGAIQGTSYAVTVSKIGYHADHDTQTGIDWQFYLVKD